MTNPKVTVFLISLKAGGVALNLTEASHCFIMDPWWNPAVENQAVDRIHRLGQKRPIRVTRLVIENSIESRIVQLQDKKMLLFQSTFSFQLHLDANWLKVHYRYGRKGFCRAGKTGSRRFAILIQLVAMVNTKCCSYRAFGAAVLAGKIYQ